MGFSFRAVWSVIAKHWAYTWATVLCFVAVALLAASCGTVWMEYTTNGYVQLYQVNGTLGATPNFEYYVYYEVYEYFLHLETKITLGGYEFKKNCDYADGDCENLVNTYYNYLTQAPPAGVCTPALCKTVTQTQWDPKYYQHSYVTMFAFTLCSILLIIVLAILLQIICWTFDRWSGKVTLVLFIVTVVICVIILIFLLVVWTIFFGHPQFMRDSLDVPESWCAGGQSFDKAEDGNVLCAWNGDVLYDRYKIRYDRFFNLYWRQQNPRWGPDSGWMCSTCAFGLIAFVFLLLVGWRPTFKL